MVDIHHALIDPDLPSANLSLLSSLVFVFLFFCINTGSVCLLGPVASCHLVCDRPTPALSPWKQGQLDRVGWIQTRS